MESNIPKCTKQQNIQSIFENITNMKLGITIQICLQKSKTDKEICLTSSEARKKSENVSYFKK